MARKTVLITDYAWPSIDVERTILDRLDVEVVIPEPENEAQFVDMASRADAILTNWRSISEPALTAATRCVVVSRYGVGVDNIPVDLATDLGIIVSNVPDFCVDEVSDHTLALILACARRLVRFDRSTSAGEWRLLATASGIRRVRGQTLGLIGYGRLGRAVADKAIVFGLNVLAYSPHLEPGSLGPNRQATDDLGYLLRQSDYVSLHSAATPETYKMLGADSFRSMKPSAYLINTSRGSLVDEFALARALTEGGLAGAALDVLATEPPPLDHPLLNLDNVIVTPHAAFYSEEAISDVQTRAAQHAASALSGNVPDSVVNPEVLRSQRLRLTKSGA